MASNLREKDYAPQRLCFAIPNDAQDLPASLAEKKPMEIFTTDHHFEQVNCP